MKLLVKAKKKLCWRSQDDDDLVVLGNLTQPPISGVSSTNSTARVGKATQIAMIGRFEQPRTVFRQSPD